MRLAALAILTAVILLLRHALRPEPVKPLPNVWTDDVDWEAWPA